MSLSKQAEEIAAKWDGEGSLPTLYARTAKGGINTWECWVEGSLVYVKWGQEAGASQIAPFECQAKNVGRSNATTAEEQAISEARAKWVKQIKKKYHWDRERTAIVKNLKPMLAKDYFEHADNIEFPVTVQPKLDGVRCLAFWEDGKIRLMSRGGETYDVEHIRRFVEDHLDLPEWMALDGEIYNHDLALQQTMSLVKRPQPDSISLQYHVYDVINLDKLRSGQNDHRWGLRVFRLEVYRVTLESDVVQIVENTPAHSHDAVIEAERKFREQGFEGAIVRTIPGLYRLGFRSSDLLKVKTFQDDEFEIVGWKRGRGKNINVPIFVCKVPSGKTFDCVPRGTAQERREMLREADSYVGQLLKVQYFQLTNGGIPQFPVGLAIRTSEDL